jgi:hypothetical protein
MRAQNIEALSKIPKAIAIILNRIYMKVENASGIATG